MTTSESSLSIQYISTEESFIDVKSTVEIPFDFRESKQVKVKENDEHLIEGQDYEVLIGLEKDDNITQYSYKKVYGYVRMLKDIPINNVLTLYRETPKTQESEYRMHRRLDVQNIENSFDKVTMITQELGSDSAEIREDLTDAQTDILELEDRASAVETRATALEAGLTSAQSDINDTKKRVKKAEGIVSDMHDTVSSFDSRVTDLEADAVITRERVTYTELKSNTNDSRITKLEETAITEEVLDSKGYLTEHQDISHLATKEELPDISGFATKEEIPDISTKQDVLIAGENIKTINGVSILGEGNVTIEGGGVADYPSLTDKPSINGVELNGNKTTTDLGLFDGDYENLTNKPEIPDLSGIYNKQEIDTKLKTKQDVIPDLGDIRRGVEAASDALSIANNVKQDLNTKQDIISDLSTIRSNANLGAQAYDKVPKQGDIIYTFKDEDGYERAVNKTIKKIAGDYVLCTDGSVFCIVPSFEYDYSNTDKGSTIFDNFSNGLYYVTDNGLDVISDGVDSYYLTTDHVLWKYYNDRYGIYQYSQVRIFNGVKEVKCSKTTMWILDLDNNLLGKGDNLCNQQGMTLDEINELQDSRNWSDLLYVSDFVVRAENVEEFGCTEFATYYKKDGQYYTAGLCNNTSLMFSTQFLHYTEGFRALTNYFDGPPNANIAMGSMIDCDSTDNIHTDNRDISNVCEKIRERVIEGLESFIEAPEGSTVPGYYTIDISDISATFTVELIYQLAYNTSGAPQYRREITTYKLGNGYMPSEPYPATGEYVYIYYCVPVLNILNITNPTSEKFIIPATYTSSLLTIEPKEIQTCGATTWYIDSLGKLYGIGLNNYGQQGSGNTTNVTSFTARESANEVIKVYCDHGNTYYLTLDGTLYGTGYNFDGQITKHRYYTTDLSGGKTITKFLKIADNVRDFSVLTANFNDRYNITDIESTEGKPYFQSLVYFTKDNNIVKIYGAFGKILNSDYYDDSGVYHPWVLDIDTHVDKVVTKNMQITNARPFICDGRSVTNTTLAYHSSKIKKTTTLYRLLNTQTEHYHHDLWTTDPYICEKEKGDVSKLYRHICKGGGRGRDVGFCNIQEDISISWGVVTSASGFYDGRYVVSLDESVKADNDRIWYNHYQKGESYNQICYAKNKDYYAERPVDYVNVGGVNNIYGNANTKISDSRWHVGVASEPTYLAIGEQTTGAWVKTSLVHSSTISSVYNENLFDMEFDFLVGSVISGTPAIIYSYRTLIIRPNNANGDINFYMAGYNSSGLKWRHSNVSTGMSVKTNTKYHFKFYTTRTATEISGLGNNYEYKMELTEYDKYGNLTDNVQSYYFKSNYLPCCYYSNSVTNSLANLIDTETLSTGIYLDLDSVKISYGQHVRDWTCYQPSLYTKSISGQVYGGGTSNSPVILPDLCEDSKFARLEY